MPSSTTFVFIVSRFSAVLGDLQDFEKKSLLKWEFKKFLEENFKKMVDPTETAHISKIFS